MAGQTKQKADAKAVDEKAKDPNAEAVTGDDLQALPEDQSSIEEVRKATEKALPAADRVAGKAGAATQGAFMDQMSRRSDADALEGHFVTINLDDKDVQDEYARIFPEDKFPGGYTGNYGVYLEPLEADDNGIPTKVVVRLRDDTNARLVVPYSALTPAGPRGR